jgi:regulator of protease activity HflC (stomatin/prohibitin superfamily)
VAAIGLSGCGRNVPVGYVGIKVSQYGSNAGVAPQPLDVGWHGLGLGESLELYPAYAKQYQWTGKGDGDKVDADESFHFNDIHALAVSGNVLIQVHVDRDKAPWLYSHYRKDFEDLLNSNIRASALSYISLASEKMSVEDMYTGGREKIIRDAEARLKQEWGPQGVVVEKLQWLGSLTYPDSVTEAITAKARADAQAAAAQAQVEVTKAEAQQKIEEARGEAESNRLLAESIKTNPEVIQLKAIDKWDGALPSVTSGGVPFINLDTKH